MKMAFSMLTRKKRQKRLGALKEEKRNAFREAADTNADGVISAQERRDAFETRREKHRAKRQAIKAQFDTNEDGVLNPEEKEALRDFLRQRIRLEGLEDTEDVR